MIWGIFKDWHKETLILVLILLPLSIFAQEYAYTEDGKKIVIYDDGTWEAIKEKRETSYVTFGTKKLKAGVSEMLYGKKDWINEDEFSERIDTQLAIKDGQVMIIFWHYTQTEEFGPDPTWKSDDVFLYTKNGDAIRLVDREMRGTTNIDNGLTQSWAAYYLTDAECEKLKSQGVQSFTFTKFIDGQKKVQVNGDAYTVRNQLVALGK